MRSAIQTGDISKILHETHSLKGAVLNLGFWEICEILEKIAMRVRGNETILVGEDEEEVGKLAVQILHRQKYEVLEAANGEEALVICEKLKRPMHLLLADIVMPRLDGPELARRLKYLYPEIKVIFMSGYSDKGIFQRGILDPETGLLQKPSSLESLTGKVREALDHQST